MTSTLTRERLDALEEGVSNATKSPGSSRRRELSPDDEVRPKDNPRASPRRSETGMDDPHPSSFTRGLEEKREHVGAILQEKEKAYQQVIQGYSVQAPQLQADAQETLMYPGKIKTTAVAQELSIFQTIIKWNFALIEEDCCHYHAASRVLERFTKRMRQQHDQCLLFNVDEYGEMPQCGSCGILTTDLGPDRASCSLCQAFKSVERVAL
jgi:hypothetical protein